MSATNRSLLGAAAALLLAGCGGSSGSGGGNVDAWLGNWNRTGTQATTCGAASATTQLSGVVIIAAGSSAGTVKTSSDNCDQVWDISGDKATLQAGQSCTVSVNGVSATIMLTQGSATLSGTTITGTEAGSATNGCSFNQQSTLTKM